SGPATVDLTVPPVKNQPQAAAQAALQNAGFDVTVNMVQNDQVAAGIVVDVNPPEGSKVTVDKGNRGKATLIVSAGQSTVPMPGVVGQQSDDAVNFLRAQGFTNVTVSRQFNDNGVPVDEVFDQNPKQGQDVAKDAAITLIASKGPTQVVVPDE